MSTPHVVIFGATGLVGEAAQRAFTRAGYRVTGVSRRGPDLELDLTDSARCRAVLAGDAFDDVSHIRVRRALRARRPGRWLA
ncbi:MAG: NAD-dependent epimerase/dehydratase family protein [Gammaproteobacteria bacterium]|nr:NAD-dependent epimerase/dehydratase family protein [Gammaproteobacteria bacterium]